MKKFHIKTKDELQKKVWLKPKGYEGDLAFLCTQALKNESTTAVVDSRAIVTDPNGNAIGRSDERGLAYEIRQDELEKKVIGIIVNHTFDWKGDALVDASKGKPLAFSKENLENFLLQYGGEELEIEGEELTIMAWLKNSIDNPENFINGDTENLSPTSPKK